MNRQVLRSVCGRAKPDLQRPNTVPENYFSTGQWLAAEGNAPDGAPNRSSLRQRSRAAVSEISSLLTNRTSTPSSTTQNFRPSPDQALGAPRRLIDVKSLPRGGLRGRGGSLRGRGGISLAPGSRFGNQPRGSAFGRGGQAGRGWRGGPGGRGAARGKRRRGGAEEGGKEARKERDGDKFDKMDLAEKEFDDAMQFGTITHYNPSLTLASLAEFMPATPSTPAGRAATALQNLSLMGPTDPIGAPQDLQARSYAQDLEVAGVRFFANATAIEAAEEFLQLKRRDEAAAKAGEGEKGDASSVNGSEERIIQPADETVRQVIVDKAIAGHHEAPQYATDPVGLARSWHLRAETYAPTDVDKFEKKLQSLLSKVPKASAGRGARQNGRRAA